MEYSGIIDTHAHYDDERFAALLDEVMDCQQQSGVAGIINNASDLASSRRSLALAEKYGFVYAAVGVHPQEAADLPADWLVQLEEMARHPKVVAIGEIGLDYYYPEPDRALQQEVFAAQLQLANRLGLPVEIHDRDAHGDVLALLQKHRPRGCVHRFSGSPEMAREVVKLGMSLGIGGALTYKNSKKEAETVRQTDLAFLLLETDCPYLAPAGYRGRTSTSSMIPLTAEKIAELKGNGLTAQRVLDVTAANARKLFSLSG